MLSANRSISRAIGLAAILLFSGGLAGASGARAIGGTCQAGSPAGTTTPFILDLRTGTTIGSLPSQITFIRGYGTSSWKRPALRIDVKPPCTQINIVVEYEGTPTGWTVDIGDLPTDNGGGGGTMPDDSGTPTCNDAEVQVYQLKLSVFSNEVPTCTATSLVTLATANLSLKNSALKFVVRNGFVSWGNPYTQTASPRLFSIPDPNFPEPLSSLGNSVYVSFNSVIGPASPARVGTGARRVTITLQ